MHILMHGSDLALRRNDVLQGERLAPVGVGVGLKGSQI